MKILFLVAHLQSGGAERTVSYITKYLADKRVDVTILSLSDKIFYSIDENVKYEILDIPTDATNIVGRCYRIWQRMTKVNKYLKNNKPDVVFCIMPDMAKYILDIHKKQGFKLITSERNNPAVELREGEQKLKNKVFNQADGIVFQTQRAKDFYSEDISRKGIVIHNAIGNECVYEAPVVVERKKKITAIGRVSDQKDYPTLFKAFKLVTDKYSDYILEVFGNDTQKAHLTGLLNELNIAEKVIFKGTHRDAILQAADSACYVMSSKYEGMPNALMEAMAVGLPCVSTDCPNGPAELITSGENGLLVPVGAVQALSEAILKMIEDKEFAEKCGENARKILKTHSIEIKAKEYMDYILKIYNEE